jgi:hypothetical protein
MTREHGIIMSAPMVPLVIAGTKTQTRRIAKPQPMFFNNEWQWRSVKCRSMVTIDEMRSLSPYGARGDRMWVRERWRTEERESDSVDGIRFAADDAFVPIENSVKGADQWVLAHDNGKHGTSWRSPIYMPRWVARAVLKIVEVRVQRLSEITESDARAEGCESVTGGVPRTTLSAREMFACRWDQINGHRALWSTDPWVWAITFKRAS